MERSVAWAIAAAAGEAGAIALLAEEGLRWTATVGGVTPEDSISMHSLYSHEPIVEDKRLILPLSREKRPIGVLYLIATERTFNAQKLEFVTRVADTIAIAVENARLYEALRQANLAKSEFVSLVSHELRTPMTSILGYSEMLLKGMVGSLAPQQHEFVEAIARSVNRMQILVNDLTDISRIETGRLMLKSRAISFKGTFEEARQLLQDRLEEKQQSFISDIWERLPMIQADPDRLTQILVNLIGNAIKYTPYQGTIAVRTWLPPEDPGYIRCAISDTGIGISAENQLRLFTKFYRADDAAVREQPGTGLGLAITKNLIEMHGGRIWLESAAGKGSTFFFTMPIALPGSNGMMM